MATFEDMTGNNVLPGSWERFPPQSLTGADPLKMWVLKSPWLYPRPAHSVKCPTDIQQSHFLKKFR